MGKSPFNGKITFFNRKITMLNGKITMFNGKITIFNGRNTIFDRKITIFNGTIMGYLPEIKHGFLELLKSVICSERETPMKLVDVQLPRLISRGY